MLYFKYIIKIKKVTVPASQDKANNSSIKPSERSMLPFIFITDLIKDERRVITFYSW